MKEHHFAFLVHPRGFEDIYIKYPIARYVSKYFVRRILLTIGPIVVGKVYGLKTLDGTSVKGEIITVPMTARDMLADRSRAALEVARAIELAEKHGATMVGLGSLTSVVVSGGTDVAGKYTTKITNGNALTVFMAYEGIRIICDKKSVDLKKAVVAVVGGTGSTGSAISKILARDAGVRNEILIGRTPEHLSAAVKEMQAAYSDMNIRFTTDVHEIIHADIIVVATSADSAIIEPKDLKKNAIIYDVTQPQNVPRSVVQERSDVVVVDGAISKLPEGVGYTLNMGLSKGESFSCLAETMILGTENYEKDFSIGRVTLDNIDVISELAKKYGFTRAPLRSFGKIID
jgi:predicted amino acid dehydrogenase